MNDLVWVINTFALMEVSKSDVTKLMQIDPHIDLDADCVLDLLDKDGIEYAQSIFPCNDTLRSLLNEESKDDMFIIKCYDKYFLAYDIVIADIADAAEDVCVAFERTLERSGYSNVFLSTPGDTIWNEFNCSAECEDVYTDGEDTYKEDQERRLS